MNKTVAVIASILFIFSFVGATFSAEKGENIKLAAGAITAIDKGAKTITIKEDKKEALTFFFDNKTVLIMSNGGKIADIKIGDIVVLVYNEVNGKNIVKSITIASQASSSPSEKGSKPAKPEEKK